MLDTKPRVRAAFFSVVLFIGFLAWFIDSRSYGPSDLVTYEGNIDSYSCYQRKAIAPDKLNYIRLDTGTEFYVGKKAVQLISNCSDRPQAYFKGRSVTLLVEPDTEEVWEWYLDGELVYDVADSVSGIKMSLHFLWLIVALIVIPRLISKLNQLEDAGT